MLEDKHGRIHDYLRISITDACNLRCTYCMPDQPVFSPEEKLMSASEIISLARIFVGLGVRKIRLTGGEPLIRRDFNEILEGLSKLNVVGLKEVTLTTNGIRLHEHLDALTDAAVRSVNISLDTLLPERFSAIAKRDRFHQVISNIHLLLDRQFNVKINMVVMKGVNDDEVIDFIQWTRDYPIHVRFIEFMPFEGNHWIDKRLIRTAELLDRASSFFDIESLSNSPNDTARAFKVLGYSGTFAFISTMSEPFCGGCNRIRLTADGKIRNCLFSRNELDLLGTLRIGRDVRSLIMQSLGEKSKKWGGQELFSNPENRPMVAIGG
ncbi:MAG: GTP 3',8-cyclase MoaA [Bacteroidota bacterium]